MSHAEIAKQLKHNSAEIREYFEDLYAWQDDIKKKEIEDNKKKKNKLENNNIKKYTNNYIFENKIGDHTKADVVNKTKELNKNYKYNTKDFNQDENPLNSQDDIFVKKKITKETNKDEVDDDSEHSTNNDSVYKLNKEQKDFDANEIEINQRKLCENCDNNNESNECINMYQNGEGKKFELNLKNENGEITKASNKAIDMYLCKNEEGDRKSVV